MKSLGSMRAVMALALATSGLGAVTVANASGAAAAVACSGTVSYSKTDPSGRAKLVIYYNTSNGGTNSACMYHVGSTAGRSSLTVVEISRCTDSRVPPNRGGYCTDTDKYDFDDGNYAQYAGPAGVTGTANRCVQASGSLKIIGGGTIYMDSKARGC